MFSVHIDAILHWASAIVPTYEFMNVQFAHKWNEPLALAYEVGIPFWGGYLIYSELRRTRERRAKEAKPDAQEDPPAGS